MKILVVDDSRAMRGLITRALARIERTARAEVVSVEDGAQALALLDVHEPNLVLCDWHMPRMEGLELLERLQARGSEIPFGLITSESTPAMREIALAAGADFVVTKPFTHESLERALEGVL